MRTIVEGFPVQISNGAYRKLRAAQQGLYYWDYASQQIILEELGEFLPQVTEADGYGIFSKVVAGREVCSNSQPIGQDKLPRDVIVALEQAVGRLQAHLKDPHLTPEAKLLLSNFKLPDPARLPEFYRQYRHAGRTNVLVVWGCDRTNLDSIIPAEAIAKLPKEGWLGQVWRLGKLPLAILALLALVAFLIGLWRAWPRAIVTLSKDTAIPSEAISANITGSKGNHGMLTWADSTEVRLDESWAATGDFSAETKTLGTEALSQTTRPITLRFGAGPQNRFHRPCLQSPPPTPEKRQAPTRHVF
ncbi:MAG: hypothetical protein EOP84_06860 [Verrucomicrobiaceae bacterium]|nr:MAG: hypothetical protein EOP84_06860 [Verrucomicrobiaceae bacterium]